MCLSLIWGCRNGGRTCPKRKFGLNSIFIRCCCCCERGKKMQRSIAERNFEG